jgi:hypothetical protein
VGCRLIYQPVFSTFIVLSLCVLGQADLRGITPGNETSAQSTNLQPGDFVWQPETAPTGPVVIVVDLSQQLMQVYRNGTLIGRSTIGAGKGEHPTPTGIFTILEKQLTHHSTKYHEASMPYMERLTWDGVAIHAGNVLGKPDSHGCIHVPMKFAKKLYDVTKQGATVLITSGDSAQQPPAKPDLEFSSGKPSPVTTPSPQMPDSWHPEAAPQGPVCVVYSSADRRIYVYRARVEIGISNVGIGTTPPQVSNSVYAAQANPSADGAVQWTLLGSLDPSSFTEPGRLLPLLGLPSDFLQNLRTVTTPGTTFVLTNQPVDKQAARAAGTPLFDTETQ